MVRTTLDYLLEAGIQHNRRGEFQGHHTNQAYYKSGIISPEYHRAIESKSACREASRARDPQALSRHNRSNLGACSRKCQQNPCAMITNALQSRRAEEG